MKRDFKKRPQTRKRNSDGSSPNKSSNSDEALNQIGDALSTKLTNRAKLPVTELKTTDNRQFRRIRRLYDPDQVIDLDTGTRKLSDEEERVHKRREVLNKTNDEGVIFTPLILPESCETKDVGSSEESEIEIPVKIPGKKKEARPATDYGDRDRQSELLKEILAEKDIRYLFIV